MSVLHTNFLLARENHVTMLAGFSKPPFMISEDDSGMQMEIVLAALSKNNYDVSFFYLPIIRHIEVYKKRNIDGLITMSDQENKLGLFLSKPYISYHNVVISLKKNKLVLNDVAHLSGLRVAAFQNATKFLGTQYKNIFKQSDSYVELADQKSQLSLLFTNRVDAVVIDINIFKHLLEKLKQENANESLFFESFVIHPLFEAINLVAGFRTEKLKKHFDEGIVEMKTDGRYQSIIDSYLNPKLKNSVVH